MSTTDLDDLRVLEDRIVALQAELAAARTQDPGPLGQRDHAAYVAALVRYQERTRVEYRALLARLGRDQ